MASGDFAGMLVWTLRHKEGQNEVSVALPEDFIPDEDWEVLKCQVLNSREE